MWFIFKGSAIGRDLLQDTEFKCHQNRTIGTQQHKQDRFNIYL